MTGGPEAADGRYKLYIDFHRHTAIQVGRTEKRVAFIPLDASGLRVVTKLATEFDLVYKEFSSYDLEKAAGLYAEYAGDVGATREAIKHLSQIVKLSDTIERSAIDKAKASGLTTEGTNMTKKLTEEQKAANKAARMAASRAGKPSAGPINVRKSSAKKSSKKTAVTAEKPAKATGKAESAAAMFQRLIMEGKLSDKKIFAEVQAAFGLDDKKYSYVKWYRNYLTKQGKNPPAPLAD